ncbi:MAG: hypothetical protein JW893_05450 [Candidatus Omnitrophica bacterium]|nr:hypothetical protein [Candidatus Omnitrophota bacterium]
MDRRTRSRIDRFGILMVLVCLLFLALPVTLSLAKGIEPSELDIRTSTGPAITIEDHLMKNKRLELHVKKMYSDEGIAPPQELSPSASPLSRVEKTKQENTRTRHELTKLPVSELGKPDKVSLQANIRLRHESIKLPAEEMVKPSQVPAVA